MTCSLLTSATGVRPIGDVWTPIRPELDLRANLAPLTPLDRERPVRVSKRTAPLDNVYFAVGMSCVPNVFAGRSLEMPKHVLIGYLVCLRVDVTSQNHSHRRYDHTLSIPSA